MTSSSSPQVPLPMSSLAFMLGGICAFCVSNLAPLCLATLLGSLFHPLRYGLPLLGGMKLVSFGGWLWFHLLAFKSNFCLISGEALVEARERHGRVFSDFSVG